MPHFQIGLFNFKRHLDQLLLCILTCTSSWLSLKHPLETNSCWQHVTLTSCQPCIPQKKIQGHPKHFILSSTHVLMHIWGLIFKLHHFEVNVTLTTWCQCTTTNLLGGVTLGVVSLFVVRKSKTISHIKPHTCITGKNGWGFWKLLQTSWTPPWTARGSTWGRWWGRWWSHSPSKSHTGL